MQEGSPEKDAEEAWRTVELQGRILEAHHALLTQHHDYICKNIQVRGAATCPICAPTKPDGPKRGVQEDRGCCPFECQCVGLGCDHVGTQQSWAHPKGPCGPATKKPEQEVSDTMRAALRGIGYGVAPWGDCFEAVFEHRGIHHSSKAPTTEDIAWQSCLQHAGNESAKVTMAPKIVALRAALTRLRHEEACGITDAFGRIMLNSSAEPAEEIHRLWLEYCGGA